MTKITDLTGAAPISTDVFPYIDLSDTTEDASGTAKKATAAQIVSGGGALPLTAGSGAGVTGVLHLDPGSDDSANVLKIPVTSSDGADFNFNIHSTDFSGVDDTTFNWGFNNGLAGRESSSKHAWYLQLEYDYNEGGARYVEYHLNLTSSDGATSYRPFQFKYRKDGSDGYLHMRSNDYGFFDTSYTISGLRMQLGATVDNSSVTISGEMLFKVDGVSANAFRVKNNTTNQEYLRFGGTDIVTKGRLWTHQDTDSNTLFALWSTTKSFAFYGNISATPSLNSDVLVGTAPVGHTRYILKLSDSSGVVFGINWDGTIRTSQGSANTATPSGATAYQLPIYNAAGTLLGYIPIYAAAWT